MSYVVTIGLDVASTTSHLVALDKQGEVLENRKFDTSEANLIREFEKIPGEKHVHVEAGEMSGWVYRTLQPRVKRVVISHPMTNAWIAKDPLKRDEVDAFKLAQLLRLGQVHEVYCTDEPDRAAFKLTVQHYADVTAHEVSLKNQIKARFRGQGLVPRGKEVYTSDGRAKWLSQVSSPAVRAAIVQLYELLDRALKVQKAALRLVRKVGHQFPEVSRFDKVPGIGIVGACVFSAYIQTPWRFRNKRKLWRYCGLGIVNRSSDGKPLGRRHLDHHGNPRLKNMSRTAFETSRLTRSPNAFQRAYARYLESTHDETHARLSTQRKIITVLWTLWRKGIEYDDNAG